MTKANGIAMIQKLFEAFEEGGTESESTELEAIETDLGVRPATLEHGSKWGTLILDATCLPDDIPNPVDLRLLNEARETI
jgi:hypothetical protein